MDRLDIKGTRRISVFVGVIELSGRNRYKIRVYNIIGRLSE